MTATIPKTLPGLRLFCLAWSTAQADEQLERLLSSWTGDEDMAMAEILRGIASRYRRLEHKAMRLASRLDVQGGRSLYHQNSQRRLLAREA